MERKGANAPRRLTDRPRKASAWGGNQRLNWTNPKKNSKQSL
ncbi:hypothetical protein RCO48_01520 [Peribacillus frigoritolerans]|nr:hypothetical protein [Peribacillus frigoritolerans]